jgi:hypothetical protein
MFSNTYYAYIPCAHIKKFLSHTTLTYKYPTVNLRLSQKRLHGQPYLVVQITHPINLAYMYENLRRELHWTHRHPPVLLHLQNF